MNALLLASSDAEMVVLLIIVGIVVVSVIARIVVSTLDLRKEDNQPTSRIIGFAPRDKPAPEPEVPDKIKPASGNDEGQSRGGPVEPPPDAQLPAPPPKLLPPGDND